MRIPALTKVTLLLDALGCAAGALVVLFIDPVWELTGLADSTRMPIALALALFSGLLYLTYGSPSDTLLTACSVGNVLWIMASAFALAVVDKPINYVIILLVMLADAVAGWLQLQPVVKRNLV